MRVAPAWLRASTSSPNSVRNLQKIDKPIRMVLPFPPGGGTDAVARVILPRISQALGQPIVIDNRAGAGGVLAAEIVATSDGGQLE